MNCDPKGKRAQNTVGTLTQFGPKHRTKTQFGP